MITSSIYIDETTTTNLTLLTGPLMDFTGLATNLATTFTHLLIFCNMIALTFHTGLIG